MKLKLEKVSEARTANGLSSMKQTFPIFSLVLFILAACNLTGKCREKCRIQQPLSIFEHANTCRTSPSIQKTIFSYLCPLLLFSIPLTVAAQQFEYVYRNPQDSTEEIIVMPSLEIPCHPDSCTRIFFVSGEIAERLLELDKKPNFNRNYVLQQDSIPGLRQNVRIQLCEGSRDNAGTNLEGHGCWGNPRRERAAVRDGMTWGIFVKITSRQKPFVLLIDTPAEEDTVLAFLNRVL